MFSQILAGDKATEGEDEPEDIGGQGRVRRAAFVDHDWVARVRLGSA